MKTGFRLNTRSEIIKHLELINNSDNPLPKPIIGAICYKMSRPPDYAQYICPTCGDKTLYKGNTSFFIIYELQKCRTLVDKIIKHTDIKVCLDETNLCSSCSNDASQVELKLIVIYNDGTNIVSYPVFEDDLHILLHFFIGDFVFETGSIGCYSLKERLNTLKKLLIYGREGNNNKFKKIDIINDRMMPSEVSILNNLINRYGMFRDQRDLLDKMREDIIGRLNNTIKERSVESIRNEPLGDMSDQAMSDREKEYELSLSDRERLKLCEIDEALYKMDEHEYGICEICDEEIPRSRLWILPFTRHCVSCQAELEKLNKI